MSIIDDFNKQFDVEYDLNVPVEQKKQGGRLNNRTNHWQTRVGTKCKQLTISQRDFCRYLALDKYIRETPPRLELIVLLKKENGVISLQEVRRPDFSLIRRYKCGPENNLRIEEGILPIRGVGIDLRGLSCDGYYKIRWAFTNSDKDNVCEIGIDGNLPINKMTPEDIIDCLYKAAMNMDGGAASQLSALHDTLDKQLAEAGEDVFVYELLQNANDYPLDETVDVEFRIVRPKDRRGYLCFSHTGAPFTARNVVAICSANDQDKSNNLKAIGYKGIGFKTVFRYNNRAEVRSGGFGFAFDRKTAVEKDGFPWRTIPRKVNPKIPDDYRVQIKLFPNDENKLGIGADSYSSLLRRLFKDERPLLFIPRLGDVKIYLEDWNNPIVISARSGKWCKSGQLTEKVISSVREQIDQELKRDPEHCRIPPKYKNLYETAVSFACRHIGRRLVPETDACLYCYLPAKEAQWGFCFLMNTDMIPNGSRNDIEYSIGINRYFARIAGEKFFVWIDALIRSGQYDYDSIFALIPDFEECVKNRVQKVVEFIQEFQAGFESKLTSLCIPSESGELVPISEIVYDTTGVIIQLGVLFWELLGHSGKVAHESLRSCKDFSSFLRHYKDKLQVQEFGFKELSSVCGSMPSKLLEWLSKPKNIGDFIYFLGERGQLEAFKDVPIFLNDHGELGRSDEMFFYDDNARATDRYLGAFHKHIRHLSASTPCIERLKPDWFKPFDPKKLVCDNLFSTGKEEESRGLLKDIGIARDFFAFVAKYRTTSERRQYNGMYGAFYKNVSCERFGKDFLKSLPAVLSDKTVVDSFCSNEYTIFLPDPRVSAQSLQGLPWIEESWVRFINEKYFNCEEGEGIRKLFLDNGMVSLWNTAGILTGIADKFKTEIFDTMVFKSNDLPFNDLCFYDFISLCLREQCVNKDWIRQKLLIFPVLDENGGRTFMVGKPVFYYNQELRDWVKNQWVKKEALVMLNEKYSSMKSFFDLFNTQTFSDDSFGQIFVKTLSSCLSLDTTEKVVAFHKYMASKQAFLTKQQAGTLTSVPKILFGQNEPKICTGQLYLPPEDFNIAYEIDSGSISKDVQILDARICDTSEMREYWKWQGCKEFNDCEILHEKIQSYLKKQEAFQATKLPINDFLNIHISFVRHMAEKMIQSIPKYVPLFTELKDSLMLVVKGTCELGKPKDIVLGTCYQPFCEFEQFKLPIKYVSDEYGAQAKDFLVALGVTNVFYFKYVCFFEQHPDFCRYFWTEYLPRCRKGENSLPDEWKKWLNDPCLLNRNREVKKPSELYSKELIGTLGSIPGSDSHIPDFSGFHDREREFAQSLELRNIPYSPDVIEYLLKRDSNKTKAFEWLGSYDTLSTEGQAKIQSYRESPNALLENGQGELCQIKVLVAIGSSKNENAKAFSGHPNVLRIHGRIKADVCETALKHLGVTIISDSDLKLDFDPSAKQDNLTESLLPGLLVYVACREGDEWKITFDEYVKRLSQCAFIRCNKIRYGYAEKNMWFDRQKFYREANSRQFYYVGESQGKQVFQCLAESIREWLQIKGNVEELKDVLDCDTNLAAMIVEKCQYRLEDEAFMMTLKDCDPNLVNEVLSIAHSEKAESHVDESSEDDADTPHETANTQQNENSPVKAETKKPYKNYTDVEEEQMLRIFGNNLSVEQMNDENRLVCIRLFNSLKAEGYEPKMVEVDFVRDVFTNNKTRRASTIETNDGRQIHVISARGGVAYLPPKWWSRISNMDNGKYVVCAVLSHHENGFRYLKSQEDLIQAIGDNLVVIRVHGQTAQDRFNRTRELFSFNPDLSDFQTYALLRMRHGCQIDAAFEENERLVGMLGDEIVEEDVLDNEDL